MQSVYHACLQSLDLFACAVCKINSFGSSSTCFCDLKYCTCDLVSAEILLDKGNTCGSVLHNDCAAVKCCEFAVSRIGSAYLAVSIELEVNCFSLQESVGSSLLNELIDCIHYEFASYGMSSEFAVMLAVASGSPLSDCLFAVSGDLAYRELSTLDLLGVGCILLGECEISLDVLVLYGEGKGLFVKLVTRIICSGDSCGNSTVRSYRELDSVIVLYVACGSLLFSEVVCTLSE